MGDRSAIEWTDATWNPVTGCSKVSPGCAHCYAERLAPKVFAGQTVDRFRFVDEPDRQQFLVHAEAAGVATTRKRLFTDVRCHDDRLDQPLRWRRPRRIFVNSLSDLFHEDIPDAFIGAVFNTMANVDRHTFQLLTKRPARMLAFLTERARRHGQVFGRYDPEPWIWLGVSVENQHFADERIPLLLQTPAAVRFISAEPLLEAVDIRPYMPNKLWNDLPSWAQDQLDWVIVGGESGPGARPFDVAWARSIVRQCRDAGVAVFVKQLGANVRDRNDAGFEGDEPGAWPQDTEVEDNPNGYRQEWQGDPVRVRLVNRKGGDHAEWPDDLRVREFPASSRTASEPEAR